MPNQPPILTIKMVKPGVELVLYALSKMPFEQSAGLIAEIRSQAEQQLYELQTVADKPAVAAPAEDFDTALGGTD